MIIYIVEDILFCVYKDRLIKVVLKNCIQKGYIINKEIFVDEFNKMVKKEKIKNKLFGDNITFVNNGYFSMGDLFFIENIFYELGFIKVSFLDIRELLPMMDVTFVEINNTYLVVYLEDILYFDLKYFKDIPKVLEVLKPFFKGSIAFLGLNKCIPKVCINNVSGYYIENYDSYVTQNLLKVKK